MGRSKSPLPLERLFSGGPELRPQPDFYGDKKILSAWEGVLLHPKMNRILEQLWRKDPYTYGHCHRVANLSTLIAQKMKLSPQEVVEVYLSGLLHDVGKILTPDYVLKKPGPLTPEEFAIIRLHPVDSGKIVSQIPDIGYLADAIRGHHERIDGKGYPDQKYSEDIHLYSRIILVADTFDAMTTTRVYRKQLDLDRTYNELHRCAGTQFDPEAVKAFIAAHKDLSLGATFGAQKKVA